MPSSTTLGRHSDSQVSTLEDGTWVVAVHFIRASVIKREVDVWPRSPRSPHSPAEF